MALLTIKVHGNWSKPVATVALIPPFPGSRICHRRRWLRR